MSIAVEKKRILTANNLSTRILCGIAHKRKLNVLSVSSGGCA
jgi:hypothetical protein